MKFSQRQAFSAQLAALQILRKKFARNARR
jgi:hypothetical protein